jgi:hypothetical protein
MSSKTPQETFNDSIRTGPEGSAFFHTPNRQYRGGDVLHVDKFYIKPALLLAPHLQFVGVRIPCHIEACSGHYVKKAAARDRVIQGLKNAVHLLQFDYKCSNGTSCTGEQQSFSSAQLLGTSRCPPFIRAASWNYCYLTHNGGVTGEVLTYILNDTLTPKSFEDIQTGLKAFREKEYTDSRVEYESARDYYCRRKNVPLSSTAEFSAMDDVNGYNSQPSVPGSDYIISVFRSYVEEYRKDMESAFDDIPPMQVISYDHSFNTNARTTELQRALPPELLAPGTQGKSKHVPVAENACLYIMSANGMVSLSTQLYTFVLLLVLK